MPNPREIALLTLYAVEYENAYSNMALKEQLAKNRSLSREDKALVSSLVYGTIKQKLTLDYVIAYYSNISFKKISKYILQILRMGIYQLMFLTKIPKSATVNESVKLAKRYGHGASAGFVNALLHSVIRGGEAISYPNDEAEYLSIKYSYPMDLVNRWIEDFGREFAEAFMEASNKEPKMTIRTNTLKITTKKLAQKLSEKGIFCEVSDIYPHAINTSGFDVARSDLYNGGFFTPQDIAAMLASEVLSPKPGMTVLDMCSAPGGKATHMAQIMNNEGQILAFDIHEHKIKLIEDNAKRLGIDIIKGICKDSSKFDEKYAEYADKILADVPCSGLGIIRRKPDIKWKAQADESLFNLQKKILENAARYLKRGGEIVYSTCTVDKRENEDIIEQFLMEHSDFERVSIGDSLPESLRKATAKDGYVTFYPNVDDIDGFFICKMKKR
ncbi:MAG: 16S rRNA (cytosine(967)-C(5))-methyltransferase RsmB [Clostridia bacterium]|nr:16S rRNA (cytosine(967)-C(5))-methyltransferase RsmB [Clostridia bacterium]